MQKFWFTNLSKQEITATINDFLELIGQAFLQSCYDIGKLGMFAIEACYTAFRKPDISKTIEQMSIIGVNSLMVVAFTGISIGAVLAKHSYVGLHRFGGAQDQFIGQLIYISMTREFGPMISAIMLIARAGSSMAAELGSMKISEQIDALRTLSIDPLGYLVAPRIFGSAIIMPFLSLYCTVFGIAAGYLMSVMVLGVSPEVYADSIKKSIVFTDIGYGLIKAAAFGYLSALICCYKGMNTFGGSKGVGISTTEAVVYSCVTVFFANYILTSILFS